MISEKWYQPLWYHKPICWPTQVVHPIPSSENRWELDPLGPLIPQGIASALQHPSTAPPVGKWPHTQEQRRYLYLYLLFNLYIWRSGDPPPSPLDPRWLPLCLSPTLPLKSLGPFLLGLNPLVCRWLFPLSLLANFSFDSTAKFV